jgi:NitT/TauT family transport system permease protein
VNRAFHRPILGHSSQRVVPILVVLICAIGAWYIAAVWLNYDQAQSLADEGASRWTVLEATMVLDRPLLPAPHQIAAEFWDTIAGYPPNSPKSLIYHAGVTASAALAGFAVAVVVGMALAVGIVHSRTLDRTLMPWLIASQTVPVLAIAPMVVVVLGNIGLTGLVPKTLITGYLSFFPVVVGMVKGLRSPDPMQRDLLRTYSASTAQVLAKLRWPASMAFLFPSLKVAVALALVGAIVAELPTGAQAGLGARLLAGSYYGQTLQIWAALLMAALLALLATGLIDLAQATLARARGGRL